MRQQRLKTDVARANKELAYYQEKAELAQSINRIEERRAKKMSKIEAEDGDAKDGETMDKNKAKRMKNLKKQIDYQGRHRREFHQREPIPLD